MSREKQQYGQTYSTSVLLLKHSEVANASDAHVSLLTSSTRTGSPCPLPPLPNPDTCAHATYRNSPTISDDGFGVFTTECRLRRVEGCNVLVVSVEERHKLACTSWLDMLSLDHPSSTIFAFDHLLLYMIKHVLLIFENFFFALSLYPSLPLLLNV